MYPKKNVLDNNHCSYIYETLVTFCVSPSPDNGFTTPTKTFQR